MADDLGNACELLGIESDLVVKHEYRGGDFIILADYGIGGIKKYSVPVIELVYDEPESLEDHTVPELREMAEAQGLDIPYRALKAEIIAILEGADEEE